MEEFAVTRVSPDGHNSKIKKSFIGIIEVLDGEDARNKLKDLLDSHGFKIEVDEQGLKLADGTLLHFEEASLIRRTTDGWLDSLWELNNS
jgi:hypothetical protein